METTATLTKEERIEKINEWFDNAKKEIDKRRQYRMDNYYNCIDDYSWGGLCDKADNELEDKLRTKRAILIEQVENDGYYIRKSWFYRLKDENGNVYCRSDYGKYGEYFIARDGMFVGFPKRISTLEKKGYILEKVERTYKCVFKNIVDNGNIYNQSMEIIEETVTRVTQDTMPEYIGGYPYIDYQYDEYFKSQK